MWRSCAASSTLARRASLTARFGNGGPLFDVRLGEQLTVHVGVFGASLSQRSILDQVLLQSSSSDQFLGAPRCVMFTVGIDGKLFNTAGRTVPLPRPRCASRN